MSLWNTIKSWFVKEDGQPSVISGGNSFDTNVELETAQSIAVNNLLNQMSATNSMNSYFSKVKTRINAKLIQPYFLLQLQSYYFTNIINFECEKFKLIKDVIKGAWLYGRAGIYKVGEDYLPIYISKFEYNEKDEIVEIQYCALHTVLQSKDGTLPADIQYITIKDNECDNVAIFRWGQAEISAWLVIWPFVQYQHVLLTMLIVNTYAYNKKFTYNIKSNEIVTSELDIWFDEYNFFLLNRGAGDIANKFRVLELGSQLTPLEFIDFYNNVVKAYYEILGRRYNTEEKKERNITGELEASQEQFKFLHREIQAYFEDFCKKLSALGLECKYIEDQPQRIGLTDEKGGQPANDVPRISK